MSHQVVPNAVNYQEVLEYAPRYRYLKLIMSNIGTGSFTLQPTASQLLEWKLPANDTYNLSKSFIETSETYGTPVSAHTNCLFEDVPAFFNQISLSTASGVDLVNVQNVNNYLKVKTRMDATSSEYLTADSLESLYPSNSLAMTAGFGVGVNQRAVAETYASSNPFTSYSGVNYGDTLSYLEPQHLKLGAVSSSVNRFKQYPLSMFSDTLIGCDKDLFIPTDLFLRVNVLGSKLGFDSTSVVGSAAMGANASALAVPITYNSVVLFLAIEQNTHIIDALKDKFQKGGLKFQIPYLMTFRNNTNAAGSVGIQIQMNKGYGHAIKRIMHTVYNVTENSNTAFDCSNLSGSKLQNYGTYINSRKLQDQDLSCLLPGYTAPATPGGTLCGMDDWLWNKKYFSDSSAMNALQYQLTWCHIDSFAEPNDGVSSPQENINDGLPIDAPINWTLNGLTNTALNHYTFVTFLRNLSIEPTGNIVTIY